MAEARHVVCCCGSTRVRGIMHGYSEGPLVVDDAGAVQVDGAFEAFESSFDAHPNDATTAICQDCGASDWHVAPIPATTPQSHSGEPSE